MLPDNRLRLPATRIDFTTEVGETGQDHDSFPAAGGQPRYDWFRLWLISLLANQSSYDEPTQYRSGTVWFDLNTNELKVYDGADWVSMASTINLGTAAAPIYLSNWYTSTSLQLSGAAPLLMFNGSCSNDNVTIIPIPTSLQTYIDTSVHKPLIYINGLLIDTRNCVLQTSATVVLRNSTTLSAGDEFTVLFVNALSSGQYVPTVEV